MATHSAKIGTTYLDYSIEGSALRCSDRSEPSLSYQVDLSDPRVHLRPTREFRLQFKLGMIGVIVPIWTFGVICLTEPHLKLSGLGWSSYVHCALFVAGVALLTAYRQPFRGYFVSADSKIGIRVFRDPRGGGDFDGFISTLRAKIKNQTA